MSPEFATNSNSPPLRQPSTRLAQPAVPTTPSSPPDPPEDTALVPNRQLPIPPPSERLQYRAIGLIKGKYQPLDEQFNRGTLLTEDGTQLDAVLLGQVMSLVKKHLDLEQEHLWVVYPRTREKQRTLHVQILGVWEPERLHRDEPESDEQSAEARTEALDEPLKDGYFSVRGEIIFQSQDKGFLVVKIQQSPRKTADKPKAFKLRLEGSVAAKGPGYFWELEVQRQSNNLVIVSAHTVALLPPRKSAPKGHRPPRSSSPDSVREASQRKPAPPRPTRPGSRLSPTAEAGHKPSPKPIKRFPPS